MSEGWLIDSHCHIHMLLYRESWLLERAPEWGA